VWYGGVIFMASVSRLFMISPGYGILELQMDSSGVDHPSPQLHLLVSLALTQTVFNKHLLSKPAKQVWYWFGIGIESNSSIET